MPPEKQTKSSGQIRVLVFDDEPVIRSMLGRICKRRGYDVHTYSSPHLCKKCECKKDEVCTDIIISDIYMPGFTGIESLSNQFKRKCKISKMALMSGAWTGADKQKARRQGYRIFEKPIDLKALETWFDECNKEIDPATRVLASSFFDASENLSGDAA